MAIKRPRPVSDPSDPPRARRTALGTPALCIRFDHAISPFAWDDRPGIEFWSVRAELTYADVPGRPAAVVATASLCRVDLNTCLELGYELDSIDYDLGIIASAIDESQRQLNDYSVHGGANTTILITEDVVVDRFWRGNRFGPALVLYAAYLLRADVTFLNPVALGTRLDARGNCVSDYYIRRPGPLAQKKVEAAWRRAGFRKLADGVVWHPAPSNWTERPDDGAIARKTLRKLEVLADQPSAKAWWRRRTANQTKGSRHFGFEQGLTST